ncbi:hypothetical protein HDE_03122 [Halotydeus destructor]|nr:hypothetical protein HDE_03122 [Halotydeus destructor]
MCAAVLRNVLLGFVFAFAFAYEVFFAVTTTLFRSLSTRFQQVRNLPSRVSGYSVEEFKHQFLLLLLRIEAHQKTFLNRVNPDPSVAQADVIDDESSDKSNDEPNDVRRSPEITLIEAKLAQAFSSAMAATHAMRKVSAVNIPFYSLFAGLLLNVLAFVMRNMYTLVFRGIEERSKL